MKGVKNPYPQPFFSQETLYVIRRDFFTGNLGIDFALDSLDRFVVKNRMLQQKQSRTTGKVEKQTTGQVCFLIFCGAEPH